MALSTLLTLEEGGEVITTIKAVAGEKMRLDNETVTYNSRTDRYAVYTCQGGTFHYQCTVHVYTPASVSKFCVDNHAGFALRWQAVNLRTGTTGENSKQYAAPHARCVNISDVLTDVQVGDLVQVRVHASVGSTIEGSIPMRYDDDSRAWATYTCRGSTTEFSCESLSTVPTPPNVQLPFRSSECFHDPTWDESEIEIEENITFGRAVNPYIFKWNKNQDLLLDMYFPPSSDKREKRPVVVMIHGGAFVSGDRANVDDVPLYKALAARGYVVASIEYRLVPVWPIISAIAKLSTTFPAEVAGEDARAAVRFMRKKAKDWRLDSDRIAMGGLSAGAITSLFVAFKQGSKEGHSGHEGEYSSHINAVISIAGAMSGTAMCSHLDPAPSYFPSKCWLNGADLTKSPWSSNISLLSIHGTNDKVVPYYYGREVIQQADAYGVKNMLISLEGAGHISHDIEVGPLVNTSLPWIHKILPFISGSLNLADAECPSTRAVVV